MRILITGAGGFIGKNLLLGLSSRHRILALDRMKELRDFVKVQVPGGVEVEICDLTDKETMIRAADTWGKELEAVIYLAGNGDPAYSVSHPREDLRDTVLGLVTFLSCFRIKRLIYFSSGAVYDGISGPVSPASFPDPRLPYAISKLACEQYVKFFHKANRIKEYVILRFFGAYGSYEPPRKIYTKLARAFSLEKKEEFTIRGDGRNLIDAMYVGDTVEAVEKILAGAGRNTVVDFCMGEPLTIRQLVEEAARIFGLEAKIISRGKVPEYINFRSSPKELKKLFGFSPRVPLSEGLPALARFLKENESYGAEYGRCTS